MMANEQEYIYNLHNVGAGVWKWQLCIALLPNESPEI